METRGFIPHPFIFVSHASLQFYKDIGMAYAASCFSISISRHLCILAAIVATITGGKPPEKSAKHMQ